MEQSPTMWSQPLADGRVARARVTDRRDGDLSVHQPLDIVEPRRRTIVDHPWTWLRQVHGTAVVQVDQPGACAGAEADAAVTQSNDAVLVAQTADCAPLGFVAANGHIGVAHAGWRGLVDGVLERTVATLRERGAQDLVAVLGPCIHVECYEFMGADLQRIADRFGDQVVGTCTAGTPALDMPAAVGAALEELDVPLVAHLAGCTSCGSDRFWSHRARAEPERQGLAMWIEAP